MKRSTRRKILYGSIVFFLLACVGVLFYAQGYDLGEAFLPRSQAVIQTLLPDIKPVSYSSNNNYLVGWVGDDLVFYDLNRQQISVTLAQKENIDSTKLNIIWATDNQTAVLYDSKLAWAVDLGGQTYQAVNLPRSFLHGDAQLLDGRVYALSTQKSTPKNLVY